jgi:hypothetical protein
MFCPDLLIKKFYKVLKKQPRDKKTKSLLSRHNLTQTLSTRNYPQSDLLLDII